MRADEREEREPSATGLVATWGALIVLAGASFALSYAHLGGVGIAVAMGIAALKAALVATVFMELGYQRFTLRAIFGVALTLLVVLGAFMAIDVATRVPVDTLPR